MENIYKYFEKEFPEKLKKQLREHRTEQNLRQSDVADIVGKSLDTYQRWESSGRCLTDISTLLSVFQALESITHHMRYIPHMETEQAESVLIK